MNNYNKQYKIYNKEDKNDNNIILSNDDNAKNEI